MLNHNKIKILAGLTLLCVLITSALSAQEGDRIKPLYELVLSEDQHVSGIDWKPDGSQIAWAVDKEIRIYTSTLQPVMQLQGHTDDVLSVDWSPDGTRLASGSADSTIRIWDMTVNPPTVEKTLSGHTDKVVNVAWSPDGTKLASVAVVVASPTYDGYPIYTTWIWDVFSGEKLKILLKHSSGSSAAWNPTNPNMLVQGHIADTLTIADLTTGTEVREYFIQTGMSVTSLDWDSRGRLLLVGFDGQSLPVADTAVDTLDYQMFLSLSGGAVTVDWRGDDTYIAAGESYGGDIVIWHSTTGQEVLTIPDAHAAPPETHWDSRPEREIPRRMDQIFEIEWSPDGTTLASVSRTDNVLRLWDTSNLPDLEGTATATAPFPTSTP